MIFVQLFYTTFFLSPEQSSSRRPVWSLP